MIVGARDRCEVQLVGEREDFLLVSGCLRHPAWGTIRDLYSRQTHWAGVFAPRNVNEISRDREKKNRWHRTTVGLDQRSFQVG
jgi:hypothetical protein